MVRPPMPSLERAILERSVLRRLVLAGCLSALSAGVANANDTGFATTTHAVRREGGKLCVVGHMHGGAGYGGTQSVALVAAIKVYVTTTTDEYGSDWASWAKGGSKSIRYTKTADAWEAHVEARPCK